jgi:ABC transport system ATP-binding/permease protein
MNTTTALQVPRLEAHGVSRHAGATQLLEEVSLQFAAGEMVAIIGGSGAGKTTLLTTLAGVSRPGTGVVRADGRDVAAGGKSAVGYVPQDDIIHLDLPLGRTLMYAARLRLGRNASTADHWGAVERVLADLDLRQHVSTAVRSLSGGQRKRASIAVELLSRPDILVLDEPTSGLDPGTAREVLTVLRRLATNGTTVILTTHSPADVDDCDRVLVLANGGRLVFDGPPSDCPAHFGVGSLSEVYSILGSRELAAFNPASDTTPVRLVETSPVKSPSTGQWRQFATLFRRNGDLMARNRLTLAILLGSPALVIAMLATLFQPETFDGDPSNVVAGIQMVYWIAFAGFFFGLTYGLLQIVTEAPIFRRERSWGLSTTAYVASKIAVLAPLLVAIDVSLLAVLRSLDRLPAADFEVWVALGATFLLDAFAGLALGLLASALVTNASQATLALPMLCFPQVLFAGAMVPIEAMTGVGEAISSAMSNRWAFEALGRLLDLGTAFGSDPGVLADWEGSLTGSAQAPVAGLVVIAVVCVVSTVAVLRRGKAA